MNLRGRISKLEKQLKPPASQGEDLAVRSVYLTLLPLPVKQAMLMLERQRKALAGQSTSYPGDLQELLNFKPPTVAVKIRKDWVRRGPKLKAMIQAHLQVLRTRHGLGDVAVTPYDANLPREVRQSLRGELLPPAVQRVKDAWFEEAGR